MNVILLILFYFFKVSLFLHLQEAWKASKEIKAHDLTFRSHEI